MFECLTCECLLRNSLASLNKPLPGSASNALHVHALLTIGSNTM